MSFVSSMDVNLKYAEGPDGRWITVMASDNVQTLLVRRLSYIEGKNTHTWCLSVFIDDN